MGTSTCPSPPRHRRRSGAPAAVAHGRADAAAKMRSWLALLRRPFQAGYGIWLEPGGPKPGKGRRGWMAGPVLAVAVAAFAAAQFAIGRPVASLGWRAVAPVAGSLARRPLRGAALAA